MPHPQVTSKLHPPSQSTTKAPSTSTDSETQPQVPKLARNAQNVDKKTKKQTQLADSSIVSTKKTPILQESSQQKSINTLGLKDRLSSSLPSYPHAVVPAELKLNLSALVAEKASIIDEIYNTSGHSPTKEAEIKKQLTILAQQKKQRRKRLAEEARIKKEKQQRQIEDQRKRENEQRTIFETAKKLKIEKTLQQIKRRSQERKTKAIEFQKQKEELKQRQPLFKKIQNQYSRQQSMEAKLKEQKLSDRRANYRSLELEKINEHQQNYVNQRQQLIQEGAERIASHIKKVGSQLPNAWKGRFSQQAKQQWQSLQRKQSKAEAKQKLSRIKQYGNSIDINSSRIVYESSENSLQSETHYLQPKFIEGFNQGLFVVPKKQLPSIKARKEQGNQYLEYKKKLPKKISTNSLQEQEEEQSSTQRSRSTKKYHQYEISDTRALVSILQQVPSIESPQASNLKQVKYKIQVSELNQRDVRKDRSPDLLLKIQTKLKQLESKVH